MLNPSVLLDPILRLSTIGSMIMCVVTALAGALVFIRKESMLGEVISHTAYPGIVLGIILSSFYLNLEGVFVQAFAVITCFFSLFIMNKLKNSFKVKADSALCFTLSFFFGLGVLIVSILRSVKPESYRIAQSFLYGETISIVDSELGFYVTALLVFLSGIFLLYRRIQFTIFDRTFVKISGVKSYNIDDLLIIGAIVLGIKSIGLLLMSGMLVLPALAARHWVRGLKEFFVLSAAFGVLSAILGCYFSVILEAYYLSQKIVFPMGPAILLSSMLIAALSLTFRRIFGFKSLS